MKIKSEKGFTLIETIVALALLSIIGVSFLNGLATTSTARVTADERTSAKILAENLMENLKKQSYTTNTTLYEYTIPSEFEGYSANVTIENIRNQEINIKFMNSYSYIKVAKDNIDYYIILYTQVDKLKSIILHGNIHTYMQSCYYTYIDPHPEINKINTGRRKTLYVIEKAK